MILGIMENEIAEFELCCPVVIAYADRSRSCWASEDSADSLPPVPLPERYDPACVIRSRILSDVKFTLVRTLTRRLSIC